MRRVGLAIACVFMVIACGSGGGGNNQSATPKHGGTATIALESELRTLDPLDSSLLVEREVFYNMYDSLFTIDPSLSIKPGLVKSWDTSDPMNYKFTLQSGVKYQDGTPFNGQSVKDNITRYKTTANSRRKSDLGSVSSVEVVDDIHVTFHLKKPDATLLATLVDRAGMMLSMAAVQKGGQGFSLAPMNAGSGPFQFVEWKRNDHLNLTKNPGYWKSGLPYLDGLTYRAIPDVNAILAALKTGDIDIARTIAAKDVAGIKADSGFIYRSTPALGFNGFELNTGAAPFNDPAKRKAVALAIDRYAILKNINFNIGVVGYGPIPPSSWAFDSNEKIYHLRLQNDVGSSQPAAGPADAGRAGGCRHHDEYSDRGVRHLPAGMRQPPVPGVRSQLVRTDRPRRQHLRLVAHGRRLQRQSLQQLAGRRLVGRRPHDHRPSQAEAGLRQRSEADRGRRALRVQRFRCQRANLEHQDPGLHALSRPDDPDGGGLEELAGLRSHNPID